MERRRCRLKRYSGISKGVAFVRFDKRTEAEDAISRLNGTRPPPGPSVNGDETAATAGEPITVKFANSPTAAGVKGGPIVGGPGQIGLQSPLVAAAETGGLPYLMPTRRLVGPIHHQAARVR